MNLALEIPTSLLSDIQPLCNYGFSLAQNVLEDPTYATFYKDLAASGVPVILDNGLHELDHPLSIAELLEAVKRTSPTWVIAPDFRKDAKQTYDAYTETSYLLRGNRTKVGIVLQASEVHELAYLFSAAHGASLVCLPYKEDRVSWMRELLARFPKHLRAWPEFMHLMGVSTFEDLVWFSEIQRTYGLNLSVDTSKPIKWGLLGRRLDVEESMRGAPVSSASLHKYSDVKPSNLSTIYWNVAYLRKFL